MSVVDLSGRTILITGGAGAIGQVVVATLAKNGARVAVNDLLSKAEGDLALAASGVPSEQVAADGIRANAIAPGIVGVGLAKRQWDIDPSYRAQKAIPLGFMQPPESVANTFLFLCSDLASYMTGSVLLVDGGCSLYPMDE